MLGILTAIVGPIVKLGSMWMQGRQAKSEAKIAIQARIATGEIDYNVAAQKGMAASWKDEFLVVWFTVVMSLNFIPSAQPYMEKGWKFMQASTPDWFAYCFVGIVVATFGLKGWKIFKSGG